MVALEAVAANSAVLAMNRSSDAAGMSFAVSGTMRCAFT
jgi:hypothetical protein